jgi:hypothetical protein
MLTEVGLPLTEAPHLCSLAQQDVITTSHADNNWHSDQPGPAHCTYHADSSGHDDEGIGLAFPL